MEYAIIVCGGSGTRMGALPVSKTLLPVGGIPSAVRCALAFRRAGCRLILVTPPGGEKPFEEALGNTASKRCWSPAAAKGAKASKTAWTVWRMRTPSSWCTTGPGHWILRPDPPVRILRPGAPGRRTRPEGGGHP